MPTARGHAGRAQRELSVRSALLSAALSLAACQTGNDGGDLTCSGPGEGCPSNEGVVAWVTDGDTVKLELACDENADCPEDGTCEHQRCRQQLTVRLLAINAGELPHGAGDPEHCLGRQARAEVERLAKGQTVRLVYDPIAGCQDYYDRALAYVWVGDLNLQEHLLREGLACIYWFTRSADKQDHLCHDRLEAAEQEARNARRGIWDPAHCNGLAVHPDCR